MQGSAQCSYYAYNKQRCQEHAMEGKPFCFWHDPDLDKSGPDIKERLEGMVEKGQSLCGFQLAGACLDNINLMHPDKRSGTDLTDINLKRASLKNAHLYKTNFTNSCLLKARLDGANLNAVNFEGADLLGISLDDAKLEHVRWGEKLHQEHIIKKLKKQNQSRKAFKQHCEETEEICRYLRRNCEDNGLSSEAGKFFYKEMLYRRLSLPFFSSANFFSWFLDGLCGYGEKPFRLILFSMLFIILCAVGYFFSGVNDGGVLVGFRESTSWSGQIYQFAECLYFSVVTFTTLGYGDITPVGFGRFISAAEAFIGSFTIALYVVVFVRRMAH